MGQEQLLQLKSDNFSQVQDQSLTDTNACDRSWLHDSAEPVAVMNRVRW